MQTRAARFLDGLDESALAAMLALPLADVERLLKGIRPLRRTATNRWFDWHAIKGRLSDELLQPVRERLATERRIIRPSKRWVAGYPDLVAQWDWRKNVNLIPDDVSFGSHLQIWWRCDRGPDHQWEARAQSRTGGKGCPFCAGKRVSVTNSLAARRPDVAADWHPTKNGSGDCQRCGLGQQPEGVVEMRRGRRSRMARDGQPPDQRG